MVASQKLIRTLGGHWHGRYGSAACPCCQPERRRDQNALTVSDGRHGRLLLHCKKTGCAFADILAAGGITPGSYAPPDPAIIAQRRAEESAQAEKRERHAERCWQEARPIGHTPAELYLRRRGITRDVPDTLRFHPYCWHGPTARKHPALVALVKGGDRTAIHRTFLRPDGTGKAGLKGGDKLMLGAITGGAVWLTQGPGPLLIGEGIESTFSAFILHRDPTATAWAALSTSGMRGLRLPRLGGFGKLGTDRASLIVAVDGEKAGRDAGRDLAERAAGLGWQVSIMDPGDGADWNDCLIGKEARHERA